MKVANEGLAGASLVTHASSCGELTGTKSNIPSDIRVPYGSSFQKVFAIRLDGSLADGDCGSAVFDATTGELYGHTVAGCKATGFAYMMAACHVIPDIQSGP